jgi:hypothetical protein
LSQSSQLKLPALFRPRTIWLPTLWGWSLLLLVFAAPGTWWLFKGERLLAADVPVPPEILIVEGWIKEVPIEAAAELFRRDGYQFAVAAGGYDFEPWARHRPSHAELVQQCMLAAGVPRERIILAQAPDYTRHRTHVAAVAAKEALSQRGIMPKTVTVYTRGAHAWRSLMVYRKVFGPGVQVGVVSWKPPGFESEAWWRNSSRADDFIKETVGCVWEGLFASGRGL